jgi:hypothetical protein
MIRRPRVRDLFVETKRGRKAKSRTPFRLKRRASRLRPALLILGAVAALSVVNRRDGREIRPQTAGDSRVQMVDGEPANSYGQRLRNGSVQMVDGDKGRHRRPTVSADRV